MDQSLQCDCESNTCKCFSSSKPINENDSNMSYHYNDVFLIVWKTWNPILSFKMVLIDGPLWTVMIY